MVLRVPPYAGECRLVRVTSVLIFAKAQCLCCFCVSAEAPGSQGYPSRSRLMSETSAGVCGPRSERCPSSRMAVAATTRRIGGPASAGSQDRFPHAAVRTRGPSITTRLGLVPGADKTTQSNKNRLLSISKSRRTPNRYLRIVRCEGHAWRSDHPFRLNAYPRAGGPDLSTLAPSRPVLSGPGEGGLRWSGAGHSMLSWRRCVMRGLCPVVWDGGGVVPDRLVVDLGRDGEVMVLSWPDGELPEEVSRGPLDAVALEDLRWYLEDYLGTPFGVWEDGSHMPATL